MVPGRVSIEVSTGRVRVDVSTGNVVGTQDAPGKLSGEASAGRFVGTHDAPGNVSVDITVVASAGKLIVVGTHDSPDKKTVLVGIFDPCRVIVVTWPGRQDGPGTENVVTLPGSVNVVI